MERHYQKPLSCKDPHETRSNPSAVGPTSSAPYPRITFNPTRGLTVLAAAALVIASAGFGMTYAWTLGAHHGLAIAGVPILAALAVLMAGALEVVKPLALHRAIAPGAEASSRIALGILALVACTYSLTAELSLTAMVRADLTAARSSVGERHDDRRAQLHAARAEEAALSSVRPVAVIQSDVAKVLAANPKARCATPDGPISARVCPQVAALQAEAVASERTEARRVELAQRMERLSAANSEGLATVAKSDPGSEALATYLAALGLAVPSETLAMWLCLVPVLALEIGSLFAGLLVSAPARTQTSPMNTGTVEGEQTPAQAPAHSENAGSPCGDCAEGSCVLDSTRAALLDHLRKDGGTLAASTRSLSELLGVSQTRVRQLLASLESAGIASVVSGKSGTVIRLAA